MPQPSDPLPLDNREYLLQRLQLVLKQIDPTYTFTFPFAATHRPLFTILKQNVFSKPFPEMEGDEYAMPLVLLVPSGSVPDIITIHDDNTYRREMRVHIWGYCSGDDAGNRDALIRPQLSGLLSDIQVATEALPYWTDGVLDPANQKLGSIQILPMHQEIAPPVQLAYGSCVAEYSISFTFPKLWP